MADQVQWRGGSRQNSEQFTGAPREVTVDTSDWILRVHDGVTPGGHKMMKVNDCLKVETADKCNPNAPSCMVTVNGQLDVNGDVDLDGNMDMEGDINLDGNLTVLDKHDTLLTGDLTVEGQTNVGDLNVTGCIKNDTDPCGTGGAVEVCDDLHVHGDLTIDGTVDLGDIVLDLETDDVTLKNPGDYVFDCNVPDANGLKTQEDANKAFYNGIRILDEKLCIAQKEIQILEAQYQQLEVRVDQNEIDIAELKKEIENLKQEIIDIENAIKLLEIEIENNANAILDHEGRISYLEAQVNQLIQDLADLAASIGDGRITIEDSAGVGIGSFTVNQKGDTTITIPAGFSGDYNDLNNLPEINDGVMTLESQSGTVYGQFSANEASNTTISIPDPFSGDWTDINNKPTEFPPAAHTHTLEELTDTAIAGETDGQVLTYDGNQKLWINADVPESGTSEDEVNALIFKQKLDDHIDVNVAAPRDKDVLSWDHRLQLWVATSQLTPPSAIHVKGVIDVSKPAPQNPQPGDMYFHHDPNVSAGPDDVVQAEGTWVGIVGQEVHEGEYVLYSTDNEWHHTGNDMIQLNDLQSDWDQVDPNEPDYIHNKPDIIQLIDDNAGDGQINVNAGDGLSASGTNATANQKNNTTRTLSVKTGDGIIIDGSGNVSIDPTFNLDGNITPPGDGQINVNAGAGLNVSGQNATANQTGNTTRTFTVKTGDGITIDANGSVAIDPSFNLDGNVTDPGNGQINVNAGDGLDVTGQNATANQTGNTTRTLSVKTGGGIIIDGGGNVAIDPSFNLDGNVTAPNDGVLTIKNNDGSTAATFTANQAGPSNVTLPKGFSGSYNDLSDKPACFNPCSHTHPWGEVTGKPSTYPPDNHTHSYNDLTDKPTIGDGTLTIKNSDGSTAATFTANQTTGTSFSLPAGFSGNYNDLTNKPTIGNGTLTIKKADGSSLGSFTANQAGGSNVTIPNQSWGEITGKPTEFPPSSHTHPYMPLDLRTLPSL